MPSINLPRLRKQVQEMVPYCSEPKIFLSRLRDLLDFYGDRTLRAAQAAAAPTGIPTASIPRPVLRQVFMELVPYAEATPHLILDLCRELWKVEWLEQRLLACQLLGKLPASESKNTLSLVETWCSQNHEDELLDALAVNSLETLRRYNQSELFDAIRRWLAAPDRKTPAMQDLSAMSLLNFQRMGLRALLPLIEDPVYENLPVVYKTIKPVFAAPPKLLRPDMLEVLRQLASRSPKETAFFIRELHGQTPSVTLTWLIRRTLNAFPEALNRSLREMINPLKPS